MFMSPFVLDLARLSQGASRIRLEGDAAAVGLGGESWPGRVVGDLSIQRNGDRITIRGRIQATLALECVRCLRRLELPVDAPFELFSERSGTGSRRDEEALERDDYMTFHDGRRLDVSEQVRETLLLEVPITPWCRDDCKGLCPRCGVDLNVEPCACPDQVGVP